MRTTLIPVVLLVACAGKAGPETAKPSGPPAVSLAKFAESDPKFAAAVKAAVADMDLTADPCTDFYQYACGGWVKNTTMPSDKNRWVRSFSTIHEKNRELLKNVLEEAAKNPGDSPDRQKVGAVYGSCMDQGARDAAGTKPLAPLYAEIDAVTDLATFATTSARLAMVGAGNPVEGGVYGDFKDPKLNILHIGQGGLGLPDRDYFLTEKDDGKALLADYQAHIAKMLARAGVAEADAAAQAAAILAFETELAKIHLPREDLRDPEKNYFRLEAEGLQKLMPNFPVADFLAANGGAGITAINVSTPGYFEKLDALLVATPVDTLKAYLRWKTIDALAEQLDADTVAADFAFYGKRLRGQAENEALWKRCVATTQGGLGDVLGKVYVEAAFPGDSKDVAVEMIKDIEHAFEDGLPQLAWMDDPTRERAKAKVATVQNKIGYPDAWRDYGPLTVAKGAHAENVVAMRRYETAFQLAKVGKPVDPNEWFMSPSEVNAYYNPLANEMAFPAGILQPPFFLREFPAAMNYGAIGMVMGHELTHGFDDSGRKFDPQGQMVEWWAPEVSANFEKAAACVENQYAKYEVQPGLAVNGKLTLGENIADLGGIQSAHRAYLAREARLGKEAVGFGLTGEQLLFVAFAQGWCSITTPEAERERIATDSHSPPKFRVNGPLQNYPAFGEAFGCPKGAPMTPVEHCTVW